VFRCTIVEPLDIVEHVCSGLVPGTIIFPRGSLGLQRREEALHRRVVPDIAGSAHAANDAAVGHPPLELLAGVLGALIGVMQQGFRLTAAPDHHQQGVGDQLSRHGGAHMEGLTFGIDRRSCFLSPVHFSLVDDVDELAGLDATLGLLTEGNARLPQRVVNKIKGCGSLRWL
jgi:hypothetical protein